MIQTYRELSSCAPSQQNDVYVFSIAPLVQSGLAAITSADELLVLSRDNLAASPIARFADVPKALSSLASADDGTSVICAGGDGTISVFDVRSQSKTAHFSIGKAVNTISSREHDVAIGSDAIVSIWDRRQPKTRWQNTELNDEITALDFHPSHRHLLLAGGDDGLVSIFDTRILEEEDSLVQAVNHGPIHKAGFLGPADLYALSSDQNLALHSLSVDDNDAAAAGPPADQLGDLRPLVPCEYVIDVISSGRDQVLAAGSHSKSRVDLLRLDRTSKLDLEQRIVLEQTHGEEVVRSIFVDDTNGTIFTAGEDGRIAAFRHVPTNGPLSPPSTGTKSKKGGESRYRPY